MAKVTAWLITVIGVFMILGLVGIPGFSWGDMWVQWVLALLVAAVGVTKLIRNYGKRRRR
ncbi:MAG: hypothetical protein KGH55_00820 [Nanoarchaeota archaeon]|nr:hypothetical protein [Nanoarchaeota archaeon]